MNWKMSDGTIKDVSLMDDSHLRNSINYLYRMCRTGPNQVNMNSTTWTRLLGLIEEAQRRTWYQNPIHSDQLLPLLEQAFMEREQKQQAWNNRQPRLRTPPPNYDKNPPFSAAKAVPPPPPKPVEAPLTTERIIMKDL
jgi:hypothetical protein